MKKDLSKATFIIPIRVESEDRMRNIITCILFLLENFDTNIIVKEVDTTSVFEESILPQIKQFFGDSKNLIHIFEESDDPVFYRMKILNEMLSKATTDIIVNCDCDILLPIESYLEAYRMILSGEADVVYPYGEGLFQKQVFANDQIVTDFLNSECDFSILENKSNVSTSDFGWIQFFNRDVYIRGGMENENFKGSSPEDKERFYRFSTLGYNVKRIKDYIYHLEHSRGNNSWPNSFHGNPYMQENLSLWEYLQTLNKQQLEEYYSHQSYIEKYL